MLSWEGVYRFPQENSRYLYRNASSGENKSVFQVDLKRLDDYVSIECTENNISYFLPLDEDEISSFSQCSYGAFVTIHCEGASGNNCITITYENTWDDEEKTRNAHRLSDRNHQKRTKGQGRTDRFDFSCSTDTAIRSAKAFYHLINMLHKTKTPTKELF